MSLTGVLNRYLNSLIELQTLEQRSSASSPQSGLETLHMTISYMFSSGLLTSASKLLESIVTMIRKGGPDLVHEALFYFLDITRYIASMVTSVSKCLR